MLSHEVKSVIAKTIKWGSFFGSYPFTWEDRKIVVTKSSFLRWAVAGLVQFLLTIFIYYRIISYFYHATSHKQIVASISMIQKSFMVASIGTMYSTFQFTYLTRKGELKLWVNMYIHRLQWFKGKILKFLTRYIVVGSVALN